MRGPPKSGPQFVRAPYSVRFVRRILQVLRLDGQRGNWGAQFMSRVRYEPALAIQAAPEPSNKAVNR
jgi:hypothetical protein